jgi:hypothetical protein
LRDQFLRQRKALIVSRAYRFLIEHGSSGACGFVGSTLYLAWAAINPLIILNLRKAIVEVRRTYGWRISELLSMRVKRGDLLSRGAISCRIKERLEAAVQTLSHLTDNFFQERC